MANSQPELSQPDAAAQKLNLMALSGQKSAPRQLSKHNSVLFNIVAGYKFI